MLQRCEAAIAGTDRDAGNLAIEIVTILDGVRTQRSAAVGIGTGNLRNLPVGIIEVIASDVLSIALNEYVSRTPAKVMPPRPFARD